MTKLIHWLSESGGQQICLMNIYPAENHSIHEVVISNCSRTTEFFTDHTHCISASKDYRIRDSPYSNISLNLRTTPRKMTKDVSTSPIPIFF